MIDILKMPDIVERELHKFHDNVVYLDAVTLRGISSNMPGRQDGDFPFLSQVFLSMESHISKGISAIFTYQQDGMPLIFSLSGDICSLSRRDTSHETYGLDTVESLLSEKVSALTLFQLCLSLSMQVLENEESSAGPIELLFPGFRERLSSFSKCVLDIVGESLPNAISFLDIENASPSPQSNISVSSRTAEYPDIINVTFSILGSVHTSCQCSFHPNGLELVATVDRGYAMLTKLNRIIDVFRNMYGGIFLLGSIE